MSTSSSPRTGHGFGYRNPDATTQARLGALDLELSLERLDFLDEAGA